MTIYVPERNSHTDELDEKLIRIHHIKMKKQYLQLFSIWRHFTFSEVTLFQTD